MGNMIISILVLALSVILSILGVKLAVWVGIPTGDVLLCAMVLTIMLFPILRGATPQVK